MKEQVRVLRILEYVGDRACVERTLRNGNVPANGVKNLPGFVIKSAVIDQFPEVLEVVTRDHYAIRVVKEILRRCSPIPSDGCTVWSHCSADCPHINSGCPLVRKVAEGSYEER